MGDLSIGLNPPFWANAEREKEAEITKAYILINLLIGGIFLNRFCNAQKYRQ
jgi:hypothetical protein